ncbi:uncharacterized protein LOC135385779 [Ornithodoros turicata]
MKSVKHFLTSFGNGKPTEDPKDATDRNLRKTLMLPSRIDFLPSKKEDANQRSADAPELHPDIRMVTNANGKQFPVICNVRGKEPGKAPPASSVPATSYVAPIRKNDLSVVQAATHPRTVLSRNGVALRVSSVPSHASTSCASHKFTCKSSLLLSTNDAPNRLQKNPGPDRGDNCLQEAATTCVNGSQRQPQCATTTQHSVGDHNTNGLPLASGCRQDAVWNETYVPNTIILNPGIQRTMSERTESVPAEVVSDAQPHTSSCSAVAQNDKDNSCASSCALPATAVASAERNKVSEVVKVTGEPSRWKSGTGKPSVSKLKNQSKIRAQKRFWNFNFSRFMLSCSSSKLDYSHARVPSEEVRSSTLPRMKSSESSLLTAHEVNSLFKVTSLTSLHDLPDDAPKTCFSHGDIPMAADNATHPAFSERVTSTARDTDCLEENDRERRNTSVADSATRASGSHPSSENSTENSTERPYIMPPRALRKYIKTNFRRLNIPEAIHPEAKAKDDPQQCKGAIVSNEEGSGSNGSSQRVAENAGSKNDSNGIQDVTPQLACSLQAKNGNSSCTNNYAQAEEKGDVRIAKTAPAVPSDQDTVTVQRKSVDTGNRATRHCDNKDKTTAPPPKMGPVPIIKPSLKVNREVQCVKLPLQSDSQYPSSCSNQRENKKGSNPLQERVPNTVVVAAAESYDCRDNAVTTATDLSKEMPIDLRVNNVIVNEKGSHVELERQVDGASCSDSISSVESELTLATQNFRAAVPAARKLRVQDNPTFPVGTAAYTRYPGPRKSKKRSAERIRQLENEVWLAERELLLVKESLLRNHSRHGSRPPDKVKKDREKSSKNQSTNSSSRVTTESTEVQCDGLPGIESSHYATTPGLILNGNASDEARRIQEENASLQQELKEKCDLLAKIEEELCERDSPASLEALEKICTLPLTARLQQREELRVTKEAISSLRHCFRLDDPYQHTLDTIEQSLCTLLERVATMERQCGSGRDTLRRLNFDSTGDPRRVPLSNMGVDMTVHRVEGHPSWGAGPQASTKVVYYTEKSVTPFLSAIPKRLGEIRLRDFKVVFDRPGQYRFHFKTLDPEFGMVKEEVLHDEDVIPGWDGKIIAWVEEDI